MSLFACIKVAVVISIVQGQSEKHVKSGLKLMTSSISRYDGLILAFLVVLIRVG
jgi:hypothetical protein